MAVEHNIEAAVQRCCDKVWNPKASKQCWPAVEPSIPHQSLSPMKFNTHSLLPVTPLMPLSLTNSSLTTGTCDQLLIQHCPACFGGTKFDRSLVDGGNIHVAMDGNFHHQHHQSAGDCPLFYDPGYFLPKKQVDAMGAHIEVKWKKPAKPCKLVVPDKALDPCWKLT